MIRCYYLVAMLALLLLAAPLYAGNERANESVVSRIVVSGNVAPGNPILLSGDCSDYIDLSDQPLPISVSGTTYGATNDYGPYPSQPACWQGPFDQTNSGAGPDVTFKWTVPTNSRYTISLLNSSYDTGLEIYSFTCPVEPAYPADFICGNDDHTNFRSQVTLEFVQGQMLLIVVDGYGQSAGSFQLEIFYVPGDDCSDYMDLSDLPLPISVSGTTSGATNDYGPYPSRPACWPGPFNQNAGAGPDVTFKWTVPADSTYTISLMNSSYDTGLEIYSFTCPVEPAYPADFICGNDDYDYYQSQLTLDFVQGQSLLIVVDGYGQSSGNFQLEIFYAPPQDSLFAPAVNYGADINPYSVVAVDLDGDGDKDLAVANGGSNNVSILKNHGDGTFQTPPDNYGAGNRPQSVFAIDLDRDSDNDLAVANWFSDSVSILLNDSNGTFQAAVNYAAHSGPVSVFAADLDNDGNNDLAVANDSSKDVSILMNNGDGTFQAAVNYEADSNAFSVFAADLDGDGDNDLAVTNYWSLNVSILINNGNGTFQAPYNYGVGSGAGSVFAADLDGDDDNDLAVANEYSNNVSILINNGNATFQDARNYGVGIHPWSVFAADLDEDDDNDLAVANNISHNVSILLNNGDGTFQAADNYWAGGYSSSVFAADLDGDGDNDLAVTNENSNDVSILINRTVETGIDDFNDATKPYSVSLSQNYPNPFNAQTTIQYSVPEQSNVTIDIFDLLGRKIESLEEGIKPAGNHQAKWDASRQSSGIYLYRISAGDNVEIKKMVLMK